MTDNQTNEWDAAPDEALDTGGAAIDELGLEEPRKRRRKWPWLLLALPVLVGVGILALVLLAGQLDPLPYEPVGDAFGFEDFKRTDLPRTSGIERIEVARAPDPVRPAPDPVRPAPDIVRPAPDPVRPAPDIVRPAPDPIRPVVPPVVTGPPNVAVIPNVRPPVHVPPVTVDPVDPPVVVAPDPLVVDRTSPDPAAPDPTDPDPTVAGTRDPNDPAAPDPTTPDPTAPDPIDPDDLLEVVVPDPYPRPDDPMGTGTADMTAKVAVDPSMGTGTNSATSTGSGGWRLEGLARTEPMEPGQDPKDTVPQPPDYFKPGSMRDGFLILSQLASKEAWKLNRDDLYVREFSTTAGKPCVDFIWPGEGHLKDAEGTLAPDGSFWIRPQQKQGNYSRYFDNQKADFYHWVGIEIPPEHKDKASEMFQWKLASPATPPPGWQATGKVYEYRKGDKVRYMYVYQMPMGPLTSGVTNVDLRIYHKDSGAYLGKNSHSVTIGGSE